MSDIGEVLTEGILSAAGYYILYVVVASFYGGLWAGLLVVVVSVAGFIQEGSEVLRATSVLAFAVAILALVWDIYLSIIL